MSAGAEEVVVKNGGEPAFVADTAAFLAELRGEPLDELAEATSANFHRLFAKAN